MKLNLFLYSGPLILGRNRLLHRNELVLPTFLFLSFPHQEVIFQSSGQIELLKGFHVETEVGHREQEDSQSQYNDLFYSTEISHQI